MWYNIKKGLFNLFVKESFLERIVGYGLEKIVFKVGCMVDNFFFVNIWSEVVIFNNFNWYLDVVF